MGSLLLESTTMASEPGSVESSESELGTDGATDEAQDAACDGSGEGT